MDASATTVIDLFKANVYTQFLNLSVREASHPPIDSLSGIIVTVSI